MLVYNKNVALLSIRKTLKTKGSHMKIIRRTLLAFICASSIAINISLSADSSLSLEESEALELAIDMIEGSERMVGKNINVVCSELVQLLNDSQKWPELKSLLGEYATLDLARIKFYQRPGKVKEIIDRLNDLKIKGKLPQALIDAVDRVHKALLLKRLSAMLSA
jgi:uncharacterized protein YjaG (DUF416 family)